MVTDLLIIAMMFALVLPLVVLISLWGAPPEKRAEILIALSKVVREWRSKQR